MSESKRPPVRMFRDPAFEEILARQTGVVVDPKTGEPVAPGSNLGVTPSRPEDHSDARE